MCVSKYTRLKNKSQTHKMINNQLSKRHQFLMPLRLSRIVSGETNSSKSSLYVCVCCVGGWARVRECIGVCCACIISIMLPLFLANRWGGHWTNRSRFPLSQSWSEDWRRERSRSRSHFSRSTTLPEHLKHKINTSACYKHNYASINAGYI